MSSPNTDMYSSNNSADNAHLVLGIGLTAAFLCFIAVMTTIAYYIGRRRGLAGILHDPESGGDGAGQEIKPGLDEATLKAFPVLLFSKTNPSKLIAAVNGSTGDASGGGAVAGNPCYSTAVSCSVCLADYGESEVLRVLPECGHVFHLTCVDSWLRLHPTCPICRNLAKSASASPDTTAGPTSPRSC